MCGISRAQVEQIALRRSLVGHRCERQLICAEFCDSYGAEAPCQPVPLRSIIHNEEVYCPPLAGWPIGWMMNLSAVIEAVLIVSDGRSQCPPVCELAGDERLESKPATRREGPKRLIFHHSALVRHPMNSGVPDVEELGEHLD